MKEEINERMKKQEVCEHHHQKVLTESFHLSGHTFSFGLQENELSSVLTQTVPLECTHQELSFEWSHL